MIAIALLCGGVKGDVFAATGQSSRSEEHESVPGDRLPSASMLLKRVIISNAMLGAEVPEVRGKKAYQFHSLDVWNLLALFDTTSSPDSLRTLATFASFRLGTGFAEMYECVVLRKGRGMIPYLEANVTSGRDECDQTLGKTHPNLCFGLREYRANVRRLVESAKAGEGCSDKEMQNTFGF
jgi:hypothetical protein